jgi:hypothetical protein
MKTSIMAQNTKILIMDIKIIIMERNMKIAQITLNKAIIAIHTLQNIMVDKKSMEKNLM